jgi:hypothetical protein
LKPKEVYMKKFICLICLLFAGATVAKLSLPSIETIGSDENTEVIIPCSVQPYSSLMIDFTVANPTSSNTVLLAFGKDMNSDGELAAEEIKYQVGWEAGAWVEYSANAVDSAPLELGVTGNRFLRHITTGDWDIANLIVRGEVSGRFFTGKAPTLILLW